MGLISNVPAVLKLDGLNGVQIGDEAILAKDRAQANSKHTMRFPHSQLGTSTQNGEAGKAKVHALTPGTTPAGS